MIDNQTKIFISASSMPGNFGATIYNHLFKEYGLNAIYFPRKVDSANDLIKAIKTFGINGCSVSMPLKENVMEYLDQLDPISISTSSVNTILNKDGTLHGFNSDFSGLKVIFTEAKPFSVLIYGSGALARTAIYALKELSCPNIIITARRQEQAKIISKRYGIKFIQEEDSAKSKYDLFVNATPASQDSNSKFILSLINSSDSIFDVVVSRTPTILIKESLLKGKNVIDGVELCKYQLQEQFKIYTGILPSIELINKIIKEHYLQQ